MNIKNFGTKSDTIKEAIKKVFEENPEEFQKIKPNKIMSKMIESEPDLKITPSERTMISILLKKEKLHQNDLPSNNLNPSMQKIDEITKLALRLIIATGGANEAIKAIESTNNFINK